MPGLRSPSSRATVRPSKRGFANRVTDFAKRASPRRPIAGFPMLWIGCAGAAALMVVTGGFGTGQMPLVPRTVFWLLLMAFNAAKWQLWFGLLVHKPSEWTRASLIGTPLLNLSLPIEIVWCGAAVGQPILLDPIGTWSRALALSGIIVAIAALIVSISRTRARQLPVDTPADGLLGRAGVSPESLAAVVAEDHYCRVRRRDGPSALIHYRFGDALVELRDLDGAQVHRGAWVAADAVEGAERAGRRWRLRLTDGATVPVSATYAPEARRRRWLRAPSIATET